MLAIEIGQACYAGELHAYTEIGTQVLEKTKLAHVPVYLPAGANQLDHIQYTHSPEWNWPGTEVNRSRLYYLLAVEGGALGETTRRISEESRERNTRLGLVSIEDKDRDAYRKRASFDILPIGIDQPSAPFCFRLEDFIAWLNNSIDEARARFADWPERFMRCARGGQLATRDEFFFQYEGVIKKLLFQRNEVDTWLRLPSAPAEPTGPSPVAGQEGIFVRRDLWYGRHPSSTRDAMREAGHGDFVIAHVIYEWHKERNDLLIGRLLFVPRNPDHPERGASDDALRERSKKLRQEAAKHTITTG